VALTLREPLSSIIYSLYFAIPHLDFFDLRDLVVHNWPVVPWKFVCQALLYAVFYMAIFLIGACLVFRRKPVN
jgi:hypothetical protein